MAKFRMDAADEPTGKVLYREDGMGEVIVAGLNVRRSEVVEVSLALANVLVGTGNFIHVAASSDLGPPKPPPAAAVAPPVVFVEE